MSCTIYILLTKVSKTSDQNISLVQTGGDLRVDYIF